MTVTFQRWVVAEKTERQTDTITLLFFDSHHRLHGFMNYYGMLMLCKHIRLNRFGGDGIILSDVIST